MHKETWEQVVVKVTQHLAPFGPHFVSMRISKRKCAASLVKG